MGSRNIKCPHLVIKGLWQKKLEGAFCMFGELGPGPAAPYHTTTNIPTPCQHNTNTLPMPHQHHTDTIISPSYQRHHFTSIPTSYHRCTAVPMGRRTSAHPRPPCSGQFILSMQYDTSKKPGSCSQTG